MKKDSGYAYIVLFALTCTGTLQALNHIISGLFMIEYNKRYHVSPDRIIWVITARRIVAISGVLVGSLTRRFGYRAVGLCGTCFVLLGNVVSAFYPRVEVLYVTYGLMSGFGFLCMVTSTITAIQDYFDKRKAFATGLLWSGTSIGGILFPPVFQYFYTYFGLQSALLFEAGIVMQAFLFFSLMKPFKEDVDDRKYKPTERKSSVKGIGNNNFGYVDDSLDSRDVYKNSIPHLEKTTTAENNVNQEKYKQLIFTVENQSKMQNQTVERENTIMSKRNSTVSFDSKSDLKYSKTENNSSDPNDSINSETSDDLEKAYYFTKNSRGSSDDTSINNKSESSKHNSQVSLEETQVNENFINLKRDSIIKYDDEAYIYDKPSMTALDYRRKSSAISLDGSLSSKTDRRQSIGNMSVAESIGVRNTLDMFPTEKGYKELFKNMPFLIQAVGCNISFGGFMQPFILIPYKATEVGETPQSAAYLMSILGILSLTMRLFGGFVSDLPLINERKGFVAGFIQVATGVMTIFVPFIHNFTWLGLYAGTWGFFGAYLPIAFPTVVYSMVGPKNFAIAIGALNTFSAASICGITVAVGYLLEKYGRSQECFFFSGASQITGGALMLIAVTVHKYMNKTYHIEQK